MSRHPTLRWAQSSDKIFITIDLPDAQDVKFKLEPEGKFFFSAIRGAEKIPYEVNIDLYDEVDINESEARVGLRNIRYLVKKAEKKWWSRLLKQGGKSPVFLKVDWDKWIDEDEEMENKCEEVEYYKNNDVILFYRTDIEKSSGEGMDGEDDEVDYSDTAGKNG